MYAQYFYIINFVFHILYIYLFFFFFFQAEDGIRDLTVTGVQTCALPICTPSTPPTTCAAARCASRFARYARQEQCGAAALGGEGRRQKTETARSAFRSEEHTSELQSQSNLVCRLLLEKKKKNHTHKRYTK